MMSGESAGGTVPVVLLFRRDHDERVFVVSDRMPTEEIGRVQSMERILTVWGRLEEFRALSFVCLIPGDFMVRVTGENINRYLQGHLQGEAQ